MPDLTDQLLRALHGMLEALHRGRRDLPPEKLTMPQFKVLLLASGAGPAGGSGKDADTPVAEVPGHPGTVGLTVSGIARHLRLSAPTVTGIVDRLVEAELVERGRTAPDRRVVEVTATERGRRLVAEVLSAGEEFLRRFFAAMDEEDARALLRGLVAFRLAIIKVVQREDDEQ